MRLLIKYVRLPWSVKTLVPKVACLLLLTRAALWVLPYRTVQRIVARFEESQAFGSASSDLQETLTWAASGLARYLLGERPCLVQALVVKGMLCRAGVSSELRIGVMKNDEGKLLAHAWLERHGEVIIGGRRSPSRYLALAPLHNGAT